MKLLNAAFCLVFFGLGVGDAARRPRIVGGAPAADAQFPYQVSLKNNLLVHICSATIIRDTWVLTSATCVYSKTPSGLFVVAGTNSLSPSGTTFSVAKIRWHESYNPNTLANNVAVVQTVGRILNAPKTNIVDLNIASTLPGQVCSLSGWGRQYASAPSYSNVLLYTTMKVISLSDCRRFYPEYDLDNNVVCTEGGPNGGCDGDNGSPLVSFGIQVGILSWGIPCATGRPDVFTNVAPYRNWIMTRTA